MPREKVALVIHPPDIDIFLKVVREAKPQKQYSGDLLLKLFEWIEPFKHRDYKGFALKGVGPVDGSLFIVPFLPEMKDTALSKVIEKIEKTLELAVREGCTVAAMGGFTSIVIQELEEELSKKHNIRITSGNTTTAAVILNSIEELCQRFRVKLKNSTVSIVGASGDIGFGCFLYLADKVEKLWLTARGLAGLESRVRPVMGFFDSEIELTTDNKKAVKSSNIVICVTSAYSAIFDLADFIPGTIVCDASSPLNVRTNDGLREDVFLYHGGIATLPFPVDFGFNAGLASARHLHGCQTEGILNALDPEIPCSVGKGKITQNKIQTILRLMDKHPSLGPAYSLGSHEYTEEEFKAYGSLGKRR